MHFKRKEVSAVDEKSLATIFKALSDENRIKIVNLLWDGEMSARRLLAAMSISQPTLSHHMKILCDSGIVVSRKVGTWMYYKVSVDGVKVLQDYLAHLARGPDAPDNPAAPLHHPQIPYNTSRFRPCGSPRCRSHRGSSCDETTWVG